MLVFVLLFIYSYACHVVTMLVNCQLQEMETFDWSEALPMEREKFRYIARRRLCGIVCALQAGLMMMQLWCVDSWVTALELSPYISMLP